MYNERTGQVCPDYARKGLRDGQNGRKADRSPDRTGARIHPFHSSWYALYLHKQDYAGKEKDAKKIDLTPDPPYAVFIQYLCKKE